MNEALACRSFPASVALIAHRELRSALRSRGFFFYTAAFALLGLGVSYVSAASVGGGLSSFGRTSAGLVNLALLIVPLMALTAGAGSIASDRERGMLLYLLAQPLTRGEVLLGKFFGLGVALLMSIALGFGVVAGTLAWSGSSAHAGDLLALVGLSAVLALAMLAIGLLVSTFARTTAAATGVAIFLWLALVFVSDLGLMAGTLVLKLRIETTLAIALANPVQAFKLWALRASGVSLDVLGPAGLYAQQTYPVILPWMLAGTFAAWTLLPLAAGALVMRRRSVI